MFYDRSRLLCRERIDAFNEDPFSSSFVLAEITIFPATSRIVVSREKKKKNRKGKIKKI